MRVAVRHTDRKHLNAHWFAFEQGRILGFTHPVSGESFSREDVADALLARARTQFPESDGYEHRLETLHSKSDSDGNEVGEWHPVGKSKLPLAGSGSTGGQTLGTGQGQEADQEAPNE